MKRTFYLSDKAEQDLFAHARYIAQDNRDAAEKFVSSFIETAKMVVDMPFAGKQYQDTDARIDGMRFFPIRDFNRYLIFYRQTQKGKYVEIIRIIHSAQDIPALFKE
jgi:plasmid stabilization system protein ParE